MDNALNFVSFNCSGIENVIKRLAIFNKLNEFKNSVIFLQETHSSKGMEKLWENKC